MHPTPQILASAYEFLRTVPPASEWKLPPAETVEFVVTKHRHEMGSHTTYRWTRDHIISISMSQISHCQTLLQTLAHEMVHAACAEAGESGAVHGKAFWERAVPLCFNMGWDPKAF